MSVNKVILIGRLGKDPETRYMPNGEAVTNATLATSESWKDKAGEKQERTEWHALVFYRRLAEVAGEYLHKGSMIYVEGKLQTRKWQDKEGKDRYTTEIIVNEMTMLGGRLSDSGGQAAEHSAPAAPSAQPSARKTAPAQNAASTGKGGGDDQAGSRSRSFDNFDDDIPFAKGEYALDSTVCKAQGKFMRIRC